MSSFPRQGAEAITSRSPGFFIILPQPQKGVIVCKHYENNGRLVHVIQGQQADIIAATAVERGFVTQLDHAAHLGRELQNAEAALSGEATYEQDAALGELPRSQEEDQGTKTNGSRCTNNPTCPADDMPPSESTA